MADVQPKSRDNFPSAIVETLKKRSAYICSNPTCKAMTIAPSNEDDNKVQYIGVAAHITAASEGGPRYDKNIEEAERVSIRNAIFLCGSCSIMIDKNSGLDYSVITLKKWKSDHEQWVLDHLNKSMSGSAAVNVSSVSENQSGGITANVVNVSGLSLNTTDEKKEHDRRIFQESDTLINEDVLHRVTQSLLGDESIWSTDQERFERFKYFFGKSSNEYLSNEIESSKAELIISLQALQNFLMCNFDMYPYHQPMTDGYQACMRPDLNIDRKGTGKSGEAQEHARLHGELREIVQGFEGNYKAYRKAVKRVLFI